MATALLALRASLLVAAGVYWLILIRLLVSLNSLFSGGPLFDLHGGCTLRVREWVFLLPGQLPLSTAVGLLACGALGSVSLVPTLALR